MAMKRMRVLNKQLNLNTAPDDEIYKAVCFGVAPEKPTPQAASATASLAPPGTISGASPGSGVPERALLAGIKVIELSTVVAAPTAGALLADHGAEVIKIENPKAPDVTRGWGSGDDPAQTAQPEIQSSVEGGGSAYVQINRGKKAIALDTSKPEGVAILKKLLETADIFITNVRKKSLVKLGLDYEAIHREFPQLIYGHVSAFGQSGPMEDDPGYDFGAFFAQTGIMELLRSSDDGDMPRFPGAIGDNTSSVQMVGGIFAALYGRTQSGEGQLVDVALMRAGVWALANPLMSLAGGNGDGVGGFEQREPTTVGGRRTRLTSAFYRCKDGIWIQLLGMEVGRHMERTIEALGISAESLFGKDGWRNPNVDWVAATKVVDGVIGQRTYAEWSAIFSKHDVWHTPINRYEDQLDPNSRAHQQSRQAGSFVTAPGVRHELLGNPVLLSAHKAAPRGPAPGFGEHTDLILAEIGYDQKHIESLKMEGLVAVSKGARKQRK
jgi:crotonobetainyl-CoA:carnitine CoA-transferase CaiB-like acyl-CoA transferase